MAPFLASFIQYVVIFIILAALGVGGVFLGKYLRTRKDAKEASRNTNE